MIAYKGFDNTVLGLDFSTLLALHYWFRAVMLFKIWFALVTFPYTYFNFIYRYKITVWLHQITTFFTCYSFSVVYSFGIQFLHLRWRSKIVTSSTEIYFVFVQWVNDLKCQSSQRISRYYIICACVLLVSYRVIIFASRNLILNGCTLNRFVNLRHNYFQYVYWILHS